MKKIDITGKRNQDKLKQMAEPESVIERKKRGGVAVMAGLPDEIYDASQSLVLTNVKEQTAVHSAVLKYIIREIDAKRKAYIYQDKQHNIYDPRYSITTDRIVELLADADLLCH